MSELNNPSTKGIDADNTHHRSKGGRQYKVYPKKLQCPSCPKKFAFQCSLKIHLASHTGTRPFRCDVCNKGFVTKSCLNKHHEQCHVGKEYKCDFCPKVLRSKSGFGEHVKKHTDSAMSRYQCKICFIPIQSPSRMRVHMSVHGGEKPFPCPLCSKRYASSTNRASHVRAQHTKERPYKCEICSRTFMYPTEFKRHVEAHSNSKDETRGADCVSCVFCGLIKRKSHYNEHIRSHIGEAFFKCRICDMFLRTSSLRKVHEACHASAKSFKCDICGNGYTSQFYLERHRKYHDVKVRNSCVFCRKVCFSDSGLQKHILVHIGERHFICQLCGKEFADLNSKAFHVNNVH